MWKVALPVLVAIASFRSGAAVEETRFRRRVRYYSSPPPGAHVYRATLPFPPAPPGFDAGPPRRPADHIRALAEEDLDALLQYAKERLPEEKRESYRRPSSRPLLTLEEYVNREMQDAMSSGGTELPPPANLRASPDLQSSFSRPAPAFVAPAPAGSLRDLPLSEHRARATSLSSYAVPHYSVTAGSGGGSGGDGGGGGGEAQLKAVAIWTHRSRGAAYTLHEDGTLSAER